MRDGFVKVAAASHGLRVADCAFNSAQIIETVKTAAAQGVKLLALPELCVTGCTCGDLFMQDALLSSALYSLAAIAEATREEDIFFFAGLPLAHGGKLLDCAAAVYRGAVLGFTPKMHVSGFDGGRLFAPAPEENGVFSFFGAPVPIGPKILYRCAALPDFSVAAEIGEDLCAPVPPSSGHAAAGASVICGLSAMGETVGGRGFRRALVSGQSARLVCAYLRAEAGSGESTTDSVFSGHCIAAENGAVLAETGAFETSMASAVVDVLRTAHERRCTGAFPRGNTPGYAVVEFDMPLSPCPLEGRFSPSPFVPEGSAERAARCAEILSIQAHGLAKRLSHVGTASAVINVSGGLDSCLALLVTVRAFDILKLPREGISALSIPGFGTTGRTRGNAAALCGGLRVSFREIDLTDSVRRHFKDIGHDEGDHGVVYENAQARERTQIAMDIANMTNGLMVGTGDLSELALGWTTFNGDHMSMYSVNASVPKTLVRHLVAYEAGACEDEGLSSVLLDILDTPVSPELLPAENGEISQRTEELVGPYELHDFFLYHILRWGCPPAKVFRMAAHVFKEKYGEEAVLRWLKSFYRRFFASQFKRSCAPDGPRVGSVSLSPRGGWHMPSDGCAALWLAELEAITL